MKKHPSAFKLHGELAQKLTTVKDQPLTLYEGITNSEYNIVLINV